MFNSDNLWGAVYIGGPLRPEGCCRVREHCGSLAACTGQQVVIGNDMNGLFDLPVNFLRPRYPSGGVLGACLSLWQDIPAAEGVVLVGQDDLPLAPHIIAGLAKAHGRHKLMAADYQSPYPVYYSRASRGAILRLWRQGVRDAAQLFKALKAPCL